MNPKEIKLSRTIACVAISTIMLMSFGSCRPAGQQRVLQHQLEEVKQSVQEDLILIKGEVQQRIHFLEEEIEQASEETEKTLIDARDELTQQVERLDEEMENVRDATLDSWDEVVANVSRTANSVRARTNEISAQIREMLDNQ